MHLTTTFRMLLLAPVFFISTSVFAQSPADDLGPLPSTLSTQQLDSLSALAPAPLDAPQQAHDRRRLPRRTIPLTPEELAYRDVVRALGKNDHRFVHCELAGGKIRTGAIVAIDESGFSLRDGILLSTRIRYSQLTASPRTVPAVGTHVVNALKWTGLVVGCIAAAPLALVFYPLVAAGVIKD